MAIALTAVAFNHGFVDGPQYTLPLCFNERFPVAIPESVRGGLFPSSAAYVRDLLPPVATVLAQFVVTPDEPRVLEVCALSAPFPLAPPAHGNLLADLPPTTIQFTESGASGWCVFPLDTAAMAAGGVDVATSQWTWHYRRNPGHAWVAFDQSVHKTYVVLSTPTTPWSVEPGFPFNPNWPWTEVLDLACEWARGAQDVVQATGLITRAVNGLGPSRLTYDAFVGAPHYTVLGVDRFLCEAFVERVHGGEGAGPLVNCSDCATIVSTLSNALGADLWQSKMGLVAPLFSLNPILGIGLDSWSTLWGGFGFHEVAWTGDCTERETVYDACLQTDSDADPTTEPHKASLPINQLFGEAGAGGYRDQIATPADRDVCIPQPSLRVRRSVTSQAVPFVSRSLPQAARAGAEERLRFPEISALVEEMADEPQYFIEGFRFSGNELPGWSLTHLDQSVVPLETPDAWSTFRMLEGVAAAPPRPVPTSQVHVSWWRSPVRRDVLLRVETFDTPSAEDARTTLLRVINEVQCPLVDRWAAGGVGDAAFKTPDGAFVMFARGNHVHVVRSAGERPIDVTKDAKLLDEWLTGTGVPVAEAPISGEARVPATPAAGPTWTRLTLRRARAQREPEGLVLQPSRLGGGSVEAFVVEPCQAAAQRSMKRPVDE